MTVKAKTHNGTCKLTLEGELTIYQAAEVYTKLGKQLAACAALELDLHAVTELDTAGVQILLALKQAATAEDKPLSLSQHSDAVVEVFELLNIGHEFGDPIVLSPRVTG
jgi:anti-sigma B factor antagonist